VMGGVKMVEGMTSVICLDRTSPLMPTSLSPLAVVSVEGKTLLLSGCNVVG
jgi:hypothetical protein